MTKFIEFENNDDFENINIITDDENNPNDEEANFINKRFNSIENDYKTNIKILNSKIDELQKIKICLSNLGFLNEHDDLNISKLLISLNKQLSKMKIKINKQIDIRNFIIYK